jgi:isopenicillin N synthase-like dioxygenase
MRWWLHLTSIGRLVAANPSSIPIIDLTALTGGTGSADAVAAEISRACRDNAFFYIVGHGVSEDLQQRLEELSRQFFAEDLDTKMTIRMERAGRTWRGYFPVGAELTLGRPDQKEGLYFGSELDENHPKVAAGVPLHGRNLFPDIPGFRETVLEYIDALTGLGHTVMRGVSLSLGLDADYFDERYTHDPLILFRIFHYPPLADSQSAEQWSVGEHTDYGLLTILRQDTAGGLQVKSQAEWIDAPPVPGSFVCNIGDMLERITGGLYRSTPHRVRNVSGAGRLSFPFFFDPNWDAEVRPVDPDAILSGDPHERWDGVSVHEGGGTYGEYLLRKVAKVFPELGDTALQD